MCNFADSIRHIHKPTLGKLGSFGLDFLKKSSTSSVSSLRPISKKDSKKNSNEIFVDIFEKLSVLSCLFSSFLLV